MKPDGRWTTFLTFLVSSFREDPEREVHQENSDPRARTENQAREETRVYRERAAREDHVDSPVLWVHQELRANE